MSIPEVQDFLADFPGWATLYLDYGDETSGVANGSVLVKELRPARWMLDAQSVNLLPKTLAYWKARLLSLQNGKKLFYGFDKTNFYPMAYPKGSWPTGASFDGVSASINSHPDNNTLTLKGLPASYIGKIGDFISISWGEDNQLSLHQVMEDFTANGSGITGSFTIEPYLRPGVDNDDIVAVKRPACTMMLMPGSIGYPSAGSAWGSISFKGVQVF